MTEPVSPAFDVVRVPLHWAGFTRPLKDGSPAWGCGACPDIDACAAAGVCSRASEGDFEHGEQAIGTGRVGEG